MKDIITLMPTMTTLIKVLTMRLCTGPGARDLDKGHHDNDKTRCQREKDAQHGDHNGDKDDKW